MRKAPISVRLPLTLLTAAVYVAAGAALAQDDDSIVIGKKRQIESKILEESRELWISTLSSFSTWSVSSISRSSSSQRNWT
jgi:glycine betaine/choline ABC-type transport system substrate-binding protein